ncbi:MAG TPA: enoyl-CoA hydratase [Alphaproteobacteria bacterium]|nr:enoyl-CoA hydratase [Alphaproteobacteria bacterium]
MDAPILESLTEGVLTLTLNRPDRLNAFTPRMHHLLLDALKRADRDPGVRVVVVTGAGRGFCSGYDFKGGDSADPVDPIQAKWQDDPAWMSVENIATRLREDAEIPYLLHTMPKVTIAAIRGPAAGSGLCLAAACDLRIAADNASFKTAFANLGRCGDPGGSYYISKLVGPSKTRELYFLDEKLDAATARDIGLVNKVVPEAELESATQALAGKLAKGPTAAYGYMKKNIAFAETATLEQVLTMEAYANARASHTHDAKAAVQAFLEKRPANFRGY